MIEIEIVLVMLMARLWSGDGRWITRRRRGKVVGRIQGGGHRCSIEDVGKWSVGDEW